MKKLIFLFLSFPFILSGQTVVTLNVNQPPELGFELTRQDTTIFKGDTITLGEDLVVYGGSGEYTFNWSSRETLSDSSLMNPLAFPDDTTIYFLTVTDGYGCSFSLSYTVNVQEYVTPATDMITSQNLRAILFPNPSRGKFSVKLSGEPRKQIDLIIIDSTGRIIKRQTVRNFPGEHSETFNISLISGVYTMMIDSNMESFTRQFMIQ